MIDFMHELAIRHRHPEYYEQIINAFDKELEFLADRKLKKIEKLERILGYCKSKNLVRQHEQYQGRLFKSYHRSYKETKRAEEKNSFKIEMNKLVEQAGITNLKQTEDSVRINQQHSNLIRYLQIALCDFEGNVDHYSIVKIIANYRDEELGKLERDNFHIYVSDKICRIEDYMINANFSEETVTIGLNFLAVWKEITHDDPVLQAAIASRIQQYESYCQADNQLVSEKFESGLKL